MYEDERQTDKNEENASTDYTKYGLWIFKDVFTLDEVSTYTGITKSYLYKLTSSGQLPHYKPEGKMIFVDKNELVKWLKRNPSKSITEMENDVLKHISTRR